LRGGGERSVRQRGERDRQDRPDDDDGAGRQGRREQVRHDGAQLRGARRSARSHPARGREGLCRQVSAADGQTGNPDLDPDLNFQNVFRIRFWITFRLPLRTFSRK